MSIIVQKFGGSSVANTECIYRVAKIITDTYSDGNNVVAVVSAQGDTTDSLILKAGEISENPSKREMDVLLSTGEQISMSLLAMAIEKMGYPVISLTGWQIGLQTDSTHCFSKIRRINKKRLESELKKRNIVIVAGFQGINHYGDITTLGRGGSDTSAVAIAAALHADLCQIYTDVDGVYTADPRIVKNAKKLDEISYDEMLELANLGADVLHSRSVEMAKKYGVKLEVLSSFENKPGTTLKKTVKSKKSLICGVTRDKNTTKISVPQVPPLPDIAFKIFSVLENNNINVDIITQSIGQNNTEDISFTVPDNQKDATVESLKEFSELFDIKRITCDNSFAKVSIVGTGIATHPEIASKMFEALSAADINIRTISSSEIKISVLIDRDNADRAVQIIHGAFDF